MHSNIGLDINNFEKTIIKVKKEQITNIPLEKLNYSQEYIIKL